MAMLMWRKNPDSPVRSALLATTLDRRWAALPDVKPHVAASMLESAQEFENVAVEVQLTAMKTDAKNALETLEMVGAETADSERGKHQQRRCCALLYVPDT